MLYNLFTNPGLDWQKRPIPRPYSSSGTLPGGTTSVLNMILPAYPAGEQYQIAIQGDSFGSVDYLVAWLYASGKGPIAGSPGIGTPRGGSWAVSEIKSFPVGGNGLIIAAAGNGPFSLSITDAVIGDPASVQAYIRPAPIPEPDVVPEPEPVQPPRTKGLLFPALALMGGAIGGLTAIGLLKRGRR